MSAARTYSLRQKQITRTNMQITPMPGVVVNIDGEGCIRGVSAEIAQRLLLGDAWEIIGGGVAALRFRGAAKAWAAARDAAEAATVEMRAAAQAAYIAGTSLEHIMGELAPAGERNAADWRWVLEDDNGNLPEVTGAPDEPVPDIVAKPPQAVGSPPPGFHNVKWADSEAAQAQASGQTEAERIAAKYGATYIGGERAKPGAEHAPSDPNGFGVTAEARRGVILDGPDAAPVPAPEQPTEAHDAADAPSGDVEGRLSGMSVRALGDVARSMGADLPARGVGEAARKFLLAADADKVIAVLDERAAEKE